MAINLVLFGSALVIVPPKDAIRYLFFGVFIMINEIWTQQ
jgi:hypothetical protein